MVTTSLPTQVDVPQYVAERIRGSPPAGFRVVPQSTPVVAFGDIRKATVATLGWNPSKLEFLDSTAQLLSGSKRRLETLESLKADESTLQSDDAIGRVFDGCNRYFQRNPYRRWFDVLEKALKHLGASYYDNSACHLDLVQWATDPVWSGLEISEQETLLRSDIPFFRQQLSQEGIRLLLLNGKGIMQAYESYFRIPLKKVTGSARVHICAGCASRNLTVIGWNINLQSSFGVSNSEIEMIGEEIRQVASRVNN